MRGRWLVAALCAALLCVAAYSSTASANAGFQRCQASSKSLGAGFYAPAVCTTTWTCHARPCWWQPYIKVYGMFFQHRGGSFSGQARFAGAWAGVSVPSLLGQTCTATAPSGSIATCEVFGSERLVPSGYKVNVLCLVPADLVPKRYVGGYAYCGLMWRT